MMSFNIEFSVDLTLRKTYKVGLRLLILFHKSKIQEYSLSYWSVEGHKQPHWLSRSYFKEE